MIIKDFESLPVHEQWAEIWGYSHFLIKTSNNQINIYTLHGFFVEVTFDLSDKPISNRAFEEGKELLKYLG